MIEVKLLSPGTSVNMLGTTIFIVWTVGKKLWPSSLFFRVFWKLRALRITRLPENNYLKLKNLQVKSGWMILGLDI